MLNLQTMEVLESWHEFSYVAPAGAVSAATKLQMDSYIPLNGKRRIWIFKFGSTILKNSLEVSQRKLVSHAAV